MRSFSVSINEKPAVDCDSNVYPALFYLNFNAVKAGAVQFKDLTFPEVMIACMCIDLTAAGLQMTSSGKETLAARWFVLASASNQIVAAATVVAMLARIRYNYMFSSGQCAFITWWGRIESCTGPSASTWLYIAVRWCILYHGLWLDWRHSQNFHVMEKDWRSLANGDQETDKQKSEYDQTDYQYMRLRATVFSKWLELLPSILVGMAGVETLVRRIPIDSLITDWGQSAALVLAIAGGIHWAYVIYQVLLELLDPDDRKLRSVNYPRYNRDSHPKEADLKDKLFVAVKEGDNKAIRRVLRQQPDLIDAVDDDNMTALLYAVSLDNLDLVIELMSPKHRANPTMVDTIPAVSLAAQKGSMKVLKYFIPKAAAEKSSSLQPTQRIRQLFARNLTMMFLSKNRRQLNPHQLDIEGRSLLWLAAVNEHKEAIEHICAVWSQDAIYEAFSTPGQSANHNLLWELAITNKHQVIKDAVLGVCPQDIQLKTLREAADQFRTSASSNQVLHTLLKSGLGALEIDGEGSTILHRLCSGNDFVSRLVLFKLVRDHMESGKPVDMLDKKHRTPFHVACLSPQDQEGHLSSELYLAGASPFEKDLRGETPFSLVIKTRKEHVAKSFFQSPEKIGEAKLLSHLLAVHDDAASWLCSLGVIWSAQKFQGVPLIFHVLDHGHVSLLTALLMQAPWPQDCIEAVQYENQSDTASKTSWIRARLKPILEQTSEEDRERCRLSIERGGGAQYLSDPSE